MTHPRKSARYSSSEIVGRFVENEKIGRLHQHQTQLQPSAFAARQLVDVVLLTRRGEEKMIEELHGCEMAAAAEIDGFGHSTHHVDHLHLLIDGHALLREIAELHRFADHETTGRGRHLTEQHTNEGGFPRAVVAHDAHFLKARKIVVEIFEDHHPIVEGFGHIFCLEDLRTDVTGLYVQTGGALFGAPAGLLLQFVEGLLARTAFVAARLRLAAHPVEFLAIEIARPVDVGVGGGDALVALFEVVGVVAAIGVGGAIVQLNDGLTHPVEKVTIVRDEQQGFGVALQIFLQPLDHFHIEVVGRFVEDEQIGVGNQHRGQRHTFALTAGKQSHGLVEFIDFELRENLLGAQLDIVPFLIGVEGGGVRLEFAAFFGDEQGSVFGTQTTGHGLQH